MSRTTLAIKPGVFFFVVGASGAGKDTLISGALQALTSSNRYQGARRVITRPVSPGEDHEEVSLAEFEELLAAGSFMHTWETGGVRYGLPKSILADLAAGRNVIANGSRASAPDLMGRVKPLIVIEITAPREILRSRIIERGRETAEEIDARLARKAAPFPKGLETVTISNSSTIEEGVKRLVSVIETAAASMTLRRLPIRSGRSNVAFLPTDSTSVSSSSYIDAGRMEVFGRGLSIRTSVSLVEPGWLAPNEVGLSAEAFERLGLPHGAFVNIRRTPSPQSQNILRRKIDGERLDADDYETVFRDIVEDRYPESEIAAFLLKTIQQLDDIEVIAVAQARCRLTPRIEWPARIIADKHSLGGIPGSRITLIIVPIVAAHGLLMPKTSSRAITSASGTADVMEAAARVDLTAEEVRRVVLETGGCIAWNGRLNHSALDDIVNAITRPLGLNSNLWSVSSILSKKWTSGSTHVVVDLPYGARAKLKTLAEAQELARIFETVGAGLGMTVRALITDGGGAVGHGLGVALELRDVRMVLANDPFAPACLREKALRFASEILSFDPEIGDRILGRRRGEELLFSGAAHAKFEEIRAAQGAIDPVLPGRFTHPVCAQRRGVIQDIDGWHLSGIARRAGAPAEKASGIDLAHAKGDIVEAGAALYTIHAATAAELDAAADLAAHYSGFIVGDASVNP